MGSLILGRNVLRNSLIDFLSQSKPFDGQKGHMDHRYYFAKNCNEQQRHAIIHRPIGEVKKRRIWSENLSLQNGQNKNHPRMSWCVGKLLSTTSLIIRDDEEMSIYWSVYQNSQKEAMALQMLAQQNASFGDWTLPISIEANIYA